jgi:hypothetical protein
MFATIRATPGGLTLFQVSIDVAATGSRAEPGAGVELLKPFYIAPVPLAFISDELGKHTPAAIGNAFGQMMVADHPADVQGLKANMSKSSHDLSRFLMQEVFALIGHLFVLPGQSQPCFSPVFAALLAATEATLQTLEFFLGFSQVFRMFNRLPTVWQRLAQRGKVPEAHINPDWRLPTKLRGGSSHFALDGDEILAGLGFRHGAAFHLSCHWPVKHGPHFADLGQVDPTTVYFKTLRICDGLLVVLAVIVGIPFGHPVLAGFAVSCWQRPFSVPPEEVLVGRIQISKRKLQNLRISLIEPFKLVGLLQVFQHHLHIFFTQIEAVLKPGLLFDGQEVIIDKSGVSELDSKRRFLFAGGVDAESVADASKGAATTVYSPRQEPFLESLRKGLLDPALANTLDTAFASQPNHFEFADSLPYNHLLALLIFNVALNRRHRHRAGRRTKLALPSRPRQSPLHPRKFLMNRVRGISLDLAPILPIPDDGAQSTNRCMGSDLTANPIIS